MSDQLSPIVVRQFRRLVRSNKMTWSTALFYLLAIVLFGCCLVLLGHSRTLEEIEMWKAANIWTIQLFLGIIAYLPALMMASAQINDELLDLAIKPRQRLHGYVLVGLLLSLYFCSLSLPFLVLASFYGAPLSTMLFHLVIGICTGCITSVILISFLNKVKTMPVLVVGAILLFFFTPVPATAFGFAELGVALAGIMRMISTIMSLSSPPMLHVLMSSGVYQPIDPNGIFIYIFSGISYPIFGIFAYYLSLNHLRSYHRSAWVALVINLVVFGGLMSVTAIAWLVCRLGFGLA